WSSSGSGSGSGSIGRRPRRKWEVFPGRNRFYCGGRLMLAGHGGVFALTLLLILTTTILFFVFDCPFLARQLTLAIPIIAAILFFFVMSCLLQTSFTDPGILPRATVCEAAALEKQIDPLSGPAVPMQKLRQGDHVAREWRRGDGLCALIPKCLAFFSEMATGMHSPSSVATPSSFLCLGPGIPSSEQPS
ncbi:palmitoyltransferase ZDHHC18-like, partial [Herpailurus yagouaroundi]|uniref:palmitoyltransferase ZDHHC18-like n=1 Tax=Herpailurus yagouaroundi TaxID=1608482 RepID=UPI001AD65C42